jgi:nicotinamidase/pyrazinamidase
MKIFVDVDIQRDFCLPDGALFVPGSPNERFVAITRHALAHGIPILGSVDSHAYDAWEFASNDSKGPNGEDPRFPDHCVKGTPGWLKVEGTLAERFRFVPDAALARDDVAALAAELVDGRAQALYFEKEVYSLFANPVAEAVLDEVCRRAPAPPELVVYGVATDYCVRAAALGLAQRGHRTTLLTDAVAGITEAGVAVALAEMRAAGVAMSTFGLQASDHGLQGPR